MKTTQLSIHLFGQYNKTGYRRIAQYAVCVCSFSHPASKAHAPFYIAICDLSVSIMYFYI